MTFTQRHHRARRARAHASIRRSSSYAYAANFHLPFELAIWGISTPLPVDHYLALLLDWQKLRIDPHVVVLCNTLELLQTHHITARLCDF